MKPLPRPLYVFFCCVATPLFMSAENPSAATPLPTTVWDFARLDAKPTGMGFFRRVTDQPTATLRKLEFHITQLDPGHLSHQPHQHPQEELIVLQQGALDVQINGHVQRVGPGSVFFFASYDWHNVKSVGDVPALYDVINFATDKTAARPASKTPAAESAPPGTLPSSVYDWEKIPAKPASYGVYHPLFNSPTVTLDHLEVHVTTLNPGQLSPHGTHNHLDETLLIVKEGAPDIIINGVVHRAAPGTIAFIASNQSFGLKNATDAPAIYYVLHFSTPLTPKSAAE
ncbi:MAG TPA: cupin domain-containing protein [Opitutus sp.]|nr:cupin domain-containing protein [Opitutus sp.]